jgi:hypothetical protein
VVGAFRSGQPDEDVILTAHPSGVHGTREQGG